MPCSFFASLRLPATTTDSLFLDSSTVVCLSFCSGLVSDLPTSDDLLCFGILNPERELFGKDAGSVEDIFPLVAFLVFA